MEAYLPYTSILSHSLSAQTQNQVESAVPEQTHSTNCRVIALMTSIMQNFITYI